MEAHFQSLRQCAADAVVFFVCQVAEEEPRPGEISRESFAEVAGIYVYNVLYL